MNLDQFSVVVDEDTRAINPQTSLGEQNAFIENLRNTQAQRNAEIQQQTHDLGTDVPSQLGGLTGGEGYFQARYQTPYTNAAVGDLRAAAQAQALSEAFDLELARANARYNAAARAARERAARRVPTTPTTPGNPPINGDSDFQSTDPSGTDIWHDANIGNDKAFYGLHQLNRPKGISDEAWNAQAKNWINGQSGVHNVDEFLKNANPKNVKAGTNLSNVKTKSNATNKKSSGKKSNTSKKQSYSEKLISDIGKILNR